MTVTDRRFADREAPCGRVMGGLRHQDRDSECLLTDALYFSCGCQRIRHEYHDGSFSRKVVHHDGHVLVDELFGS